MTKMQRTGEPGMVQTYLIDLKVGKERIEVLIVIHIQKKRN